MKSYQALYGGDDPEPDVLGAKQAGLHPIWTTYVRDQEIPFTAGVLYSEQQNPEPGVPRISNWDDLFALLGLDGRRL